MTIGIMQILCVLICTWLIISRIATIIYVKNYGSEWDEMLLIMMIFPPFYDSFVLVACAGWIYEYFKKRS